ncbi:uncharacterized protein K02A2.6-like [Monomorium pharaonis]|uniref:uncharacterized protein K02A2.6-like n=1 Tax=Monomorium pharaonis TaxID=307658 RepID=UPI0017467051|nr:uncharacterized protein K02A2.6-like [Monomorium pharaonis]
MKVQKVIEESNSPWVSPAVMVKKKDGTIKFCVDFRKLNAVTIKDSFPLPRIDNILDCLKGNSWFCTIDLKSGYWQVSLDPKDREKTAFSVGNGLWQFTVMPFGLCNAPATFERLMEKVLKGLISKTLMPQIMALGRGKVHNNADELSRRPCLETLCRYCIKVESNEESSKEEIFGRLVFSSENFQEWRAAQLQDAVVSKIVHFKEAGTRPDWQEIASGDPSLKIYWSYWDTLLLIDGVLHKKWISPNLQKNIFQIVVPRQRIHEILNKRDVENWCASCKECVAKKGPLGKGKSPMEIYNVGAPFERIQVDILGPLPTSSFGNKYLLVVVDCFSKWPEDIPLKNKRASTVARSLVDQVFSRHGILLELHTDQRRNFECHLFKEMTLLLGIRKSRTTPLHPQSDGQVERQHRSILNYLAKFISENQKDWDRWISLYLLAYRSSKQEAIGMFPAEMYLGQDLRLPLDLLRGVSPSTKEEKDSAGFVSKLRQRLDSIHHFARQRLLISSKNAKFWYDQRARRKNFEPGQQVWFYNPRRIPGRAPKLQSPWEGPWKVVPAEIVRKTIFVAESGLISETMSGQCRKQSTPQI